MNGLGFIRKHITNILDMVDLLIGFVITLVSLLLGFSLGKHQAPISPDVTRKINSLFKRVAPKSDVGIIERPTAEDNYYRDHPEAKAEAQEMGRAIERLK